MGLNRIERTAGFEITNGTSYTVDSSSGFQAISIAVTSDSTNSATVSGTISSVANKQGGNISATGVTVSAGESLTIGSPNGSILDGIIITAGASCTVKIFGLG